MTTTRKTFTLQADDRQAAEPLRPGAIDAATGLVGKTVRISLIRPASASGEDRPVLIEGVIWFDNAWRLLTSHTTPFGRHWTPRLGVIASVKVVPDPRPVEVVSFTARAWA